MAAPGKEAPFAPFTAQLSAVRGVLYWRQGEAKQNFGDFLSELFLQRALVAPAFRDQYFLLIGSVIAESWYRRHASRSGRLAFWGCGMRDETPIALEYRAKSRFCGVRGPLTRDLLGLPDDTVLGDPGLLLPALYRPRRRPAVGRLCILHVLDPRSEREVKAQTGADRVVRADVAPSMAALAAFIDLIAAADVVLSGALHGAIVACAYGRPFSYFDSGYVDIPFKWRDFAASVGIGGSFATTMAEAHAIHEDEIRSRCRLPPLTPILQQAPFAVRHDALIRTLVHDRQLSPEAGREALLALRQAGADAPQRVAAARADWNAGWMSRWGRTLGRRRGAR